MTTTDKTSFPLCWPEGWPRTSRGAQRSSRFKRPTNFRGVNTFASRSHSMDESARLLADEIGRLGASDGILSTNVRLRLDGKPYSAQAQPSDTGAAVYFKLNGKPISLACDRWDRVEDNVWAIAKHIEALRAQDRWGVGSIERAFRGYTALPGIGESSASDWWRVLGVPVNAEPDQVKQAYRVLAAKHHPDAGGHAELFMRVQKAWEQFNEMEKSGWDACAADAEMGRRGDAERERENAGA